MPSFLRAFIVGVFAFIVPSGNPERASLPKSSAIINRILGAVETDVTAASSLSLLQLCDAASRTVTASILKEKGMDIIAVFLIGLTGHESSTLCGDYSFFKM